MPCTRMYPCMQVGLQPDVLVPAHDARRTSDNDNDENDNEDE